MINKPLFKRALALLLIIAFLHWVGYVLYLHWTEWWFDVLLHFLGGFCASMGLLSIIKIRQSKLKTVLLAVLLTITIGVLWEFYELYTKATSLSDGIYYWTDTISDLLLDTSGGFFSALYSYKILIKNGK